MDVAVGMSHRVRRKLLLFGKAPLPGECKTRLCPALTADAAARLARAFLLDEVEAFSQVPRVEVTACYSPDTAGPLFADLLAETPDVRRMPQGPGDLGERLARAFQAACDGHAAVAVVGSDSPDLPPERIEQAYHWLEQGAADLVLGPSRDGGYYLLAVRTPHPCLFREIPWSTKTVLAVTRQRAEAAGLRTALLPPWEDVDTIEDLQRLRARLSVSSPEICVRTRRVLTQISGND